MGEARGKLLIIGFGPGSAEHITERVRRAIEESQVIIGYNTYVDLIKELLTDQEIVQTGMTEEVTRAQEAVRQAEAGKIVAVISSGDAGVYGMAGLVYEVLIEKGWKPSTGVEVEVVPGISAIQSCASLLGAPVMHDACTISLSDHLTPWEQIAKRVDAAGAADFIIALYNPRSGKRTRQIVETQRILLKYRSPETPVGLVKSAYRSSQQVVVTTLGDMLNHDIGMLTTVIIGNSTTTVYEGIMITPRGYQRKYTLDAAVQPLRPSERLRTEAEPWSLNAQTSGLQSASGAAQAGASSVSVLEREGGEVERISPESADGAIASAAAAPAKPPAHPAALAMEALQRLGAKGLGHQAAGTAGASWAAGASTAAGTAGGAGALAGQRRIPEAVLEIGVAPGIANKKFTPRQMALLAELAGEKGELEYTPHHQIILRAPTESPAELVGRLKAERLLVFPIGDVAQVKACDFCNLEKEEAIPVAEELNRRLGGLKAPKELRIGLNGCGMACYGAVFEDIGIVYRRGAYDLFLGGKTTGRNAHAARPVAEGISAEEIVDTVERIFAEYVHKGHPNERFHKYFKRTGSAGGYEYREYAEPVAVDAVCGD